MARRAAFIKTLRAAPNLKNKILLLAAPFEVLSDGLEPKPDPKILPAMVKALDMMGYAAGVLNPDEATVLKDAHAPLPDRFLVAEAKPQTKILQIGDLSVGIVVFPASPDRQKPVPARLAEACAQAAADLHGQVRLVIGLSGWGMADEQVFLDAHPKTLDILLGSGPNLGTSGRVTANGKTLWSRSYIKGKTINRLDLLALPGAPDFTWKPKATYDALIISLDDQYPADPATQQLFQ